MLQNHIITFIFQNTLIFFSSFPGKMFKLPSNIQPRPMPDCVKPLDWLIGTWKCSDQAKGQYPTIKDFAYGEEIQFLNVGQPMLNFSSVTWHPEGKFPMHQETGFLRIKPGTQDVSLMLSHNFGLTSLEEGSVEGKTLSLKSSQIARMSFGKEPAVTEIQRTFKLLDENTLFQEIMMATTNTPLTKHLEATYKKM